MRHERRMYGAVYTVCQCRCGPWNHAKASDSSPPMASRSKCAVDARHQNLTIPIGSAPKVQSNEVYLPPTRGAA